MKFCPSPPIHFNWWTLYPKFRVYGTSAILSRTAKFIVYLRFARWRRAVALTRACISQAAVFQQSRSSAFTCMHFTSWFQAHYANAKAVRLLDHIIGKNSARGLVRKPACVPSLAL